MCSTWAILHIPADGAVAQQSASSAIRNWVAATGWSREDLSDEHAWQFSQEFRLASNFSGPLNFSVGGNYLHYETEENYYVFINTLTLAAYAWTS